MKFYNLDDQSFEIYLNLLCSNISSSFYRNKLCCTLYGESWAETENCMIDKAHCMEFTF